MGKGKRPADGQGGRQDQDGAGDSVALQKCCCLNMAPADLRLGTETALYLSSLSPFPLPVYFLLFSPACPSLLFLFAVFYFH